MNEPREVYEICCMLVDDTVPETKKNQLLRHGLTLLTRSETVIVLRQNHITLLIQLLRTLSGQ